MIADYQTLEEKEQDHNFLSYCSLICILCRKKLNLPNVFLHTLQSDQFKYIFKTNLCIDTDFELVRIFLTYDSTLSKSKYISKFFNSKEGK